MKEDTFGHPRKDTQEYVELLESRGCYSASRDPEVQRLKRAARNQRHRANHLKEKSDSQPESQPKVFTRKASKSLRKGKLPSKEDKIAKAFSALK
jgi:hypothetical protein